MEHGGAVELRRGHSLLGISSLVISVVMGFILLVLIVVLGVMEATTPGGVDEDSVPVALMGLGILFSLFCNLVGFALGVAGLIQRRKKRLFAILGVILNAIILLAVVTLLVFGLAIGG